MVGVKRKISEVEDVETQAIPSVKDLASSDPKHRRQALLSVLSHLKDRPATSNLTSTQCLQLWRGFHVAVYMHDSKNAISVQNVIATVADTFNTVRTKDQQCESQSTSHDEVNSRRKTSNGHNQTQDDEGDDFNGFDDDDDNDRNDSERSDVMDEDDKIDASWLSTYTAAFWTTIIREWSTIDSHRMNKYLLLIRLVTRTLFGILVRAQRASTSSLTPSTSTGTKPETNTNTAKSNKTTKKSASKSKPKSVSSSSSTPKFTSKSQSTISPNDDDDDDNDDASKPTTHIPTQQNLNNLLHSQMNLLSKYALNPRDTKIPNGLRIHMLDIYTDELEKVINETTDDITTTATTTAATTIDPHFLTLVKLPIQRVATTGLDKSIRTKAKDEIEEFEKRFMAG